MPRQLAELARKAERAADRRGSSAASDAPLAPPSAVAREHAIARVSQLHHGELMTARICGLLARQVSLAEARRCLALQREDELAHAVLYAGYLDALGGRTPRQAALELLEQEANAWRGPPEALILAVHVLLEGEAALWQRHAACWLPCPRFLALSREIAQDEARHIAFGRLYLPPALAALSRRERLAIYHWLRDLWTKTWAQLHDGRGELTRVSDSLLRAWSDHRWRHWQGELRRIGLYGIEERAAFERR
ncbi:MAG: ferritin-like domain-containing protein [Kiloniellales bacterium]